MHFGIISPPVSGHLHPMGALGRELVSRGHQVTLFHMEDLRAQATREGLEFCSVGAVDHPPGSLPISLAHLGTLSGLAAIRFTMKAIRKTTEMFFRDAPEALQRAGVQMLIVDQMEPAGGTIAELLKLPFATVANALALNREDNVPPPFTSWPYRAHPWARLRNRAGYAVGRSATRPVTRVVEKQRRLWTLPPQRRPDESFSPFIQISQLAPEFDYPRTNLPANFHYTGPLRRPQQPQVEFPWDRLDGRPLVYASLGTLQNARETMFRSFAEAVCGLGVQLVISHGGGLDTKTANSLPGDPLVVPYAPQWSLMGRAAMTITHAGLNTVLDSLANGVPLVAVPITYEQPAIAERLKWCGAGEVIPFARFNTDRLRESVRRVMSEDRYRFNAQRIADSVRASGGVRKAADLIESVVPG